MKTIEVTQMNSKHMDPVNSQFYDIYRQVYIFLWISLYIRAFYR